jgi:hypothetical protein
MVGSAPGGASSTSVSLRAGIVHRPAQTRWIVLDRLDWVLERRSGAAPAVDSMRWVNNFLASWQPRRDWQASLGYGVKVVRERLSGGEAVTFTDLVGLEGRHDLSSRWDVGLRWSALHTWNGGEVAYSGGPSLGCSPAPNVWLSLGYNLVGFTDRDFSPAGYTAAGPYLRLRMKFDQQSVRQAAAWINGS